MTAAFVCALSAAAAAEENKGAGEQPSGAAVDERRATTAQSLAQLNDPANSWFLKRIQDKPRLMEAFFRLEASLPEELAIRLRSAIDLERKYIIMWPLLFETRGQVNAAGQVATLKFGVNLETVDPGSTATVDVKLTQRETGAIGTATWKTFSGIRPKLFVLVKRHPKSPRFAVGPAVAEAQAVLKDPKGEVRDKRNWTTMLILSKEMIRRQTASEERKPQPESEDAKREP